MCIKILAGLLALISVNVQDTWSVAGDPMNDWAEPWLKHQEQLNLQIRVDIRNKAELLPTTTCSYSNEEFQFGSINPPVISGDISIMQFHGSYTSTVKYVWMEEPCQFPAQADFSGEIEIKLSSFDTARTYTANNKYNLEEPSDKDAGLLQALEPHKAAVLDKLQQKGKNVFGTTVGDILLKRIASVVDKWYIHVHVHYFYDNQSYYVQYTISISKDKEIAVTAVTP